VIIKERQKYENNILDPKFRLVRAVFAMLNERVARVQFKKVSDNRALFLRSEPIRTVEIDTEIDLMFECPGILLSQGSQRFFTKVIRMLRPKPHRNSTFINLDRIRCSVQEVSNYTPSDETIWKSIRSATLQRLTREFFWKCIHNTFRVGDFWSHIETLEIYGRCHACDVPETLEHIALECDHLSRWVLVLSWLNSFYKILRFKGFSQDHGSSGLVLSTYDINMKICISYYILIILWVLVLYHIHMYYPRIILCHIIPYYNILKIYF
jgi:hypothetical protein